MFESKLFCLEIMVKYSNGEQFMEEITIIDTDYTNITNYGICGYKDLKREGYPEKISWMEKMKTHGLVIKTVMAEKYLFECVHKK